MTEVVKDVSGKPVAVEETVSIYLTGIRSDGEPSFTTLTGSYYAPDEEGKISVNLPDGWKYVTSKIVHIDLPQDLNPIQAAIAGIDESIESIRAEAEVKVQNLLRQKSDLMMLGFAAPGVVEEFPNVPF